MVEIAAPLSLEFPSAALAPLDYYLVGEEAIVVEEFAVDDSGCAVGVDCVAYVGAEGAWRGSAQLSQAMRSEPEVRDKTVVLTRAAAEKAYAAMAGGALAGEPALRAGFGQRWSFPPALPLVFGAGEAPSGFRERRIYRLLFASGLPDVAEGGFERDGHVFQWQVRDVGQGLAWAVDFTVLFGAGSEATVAAVLTSARRTLGRAGLIPVTVERFA